MKKMKTSMALVLAITLLLSGLIVPAKEVQAAKPKLNKKSVTLRIGKTVRLKVSGTKEKITWRSSKKSVATVTSKGRVKAKKIGTAKIYASFAGKKLTCKVTVTGSVTDTKSGGKLNPLSAYDEHTINYYEDGRKIGTFKIQLQAFESGNKANRLVLSNDTNPVPTSTQEYIYFQFQIKYVSGTEVVEAKDLFSYYYNIYDSTGNTQLENIDWGFYFELLEDLSDVTLAPGNTSICSKAVLVNKGNTPVLYRIRTGKNSYTWFTTKK
nr:Ig-like domain-containing protein [Eubacterium sp.]